MPVSGVVSGFDEAAGLGVVTDLDGRTYSFHCVEIADGTRAIAPGTAVRFTVFTKLGRLEAGAVEAR